MCIVSYFEIILFHFIWNKYFVIQKNHLSILRTNIFLKDTVDTNPRLPRLISMPQAVDCDPQAVTGVSQVL